MVLSLHKQPFITTHFQFITAHFVRHCALKNVLFYVIHSHSPGGTMSSPSQSHTQCSQHLGRHNRFKIFRKIHPWLCSNISVWLTAEWYNQQNLNENTSRLVTRHLGCLHYCTRYIYLMCNFSKLNNYQYVCVLFDLDDTDPNMFDVVDRKQFSKITNVWRPQTCLRCLTYWNHACLLS